MATAAPLLLMTVPDIVQERLGDEEVGGRIPLGGESELLVTRTRTLVYRAEGLLSGESVEEYPHDAERIEVQSGRRKSKIALDYGIDGAESIAVPTDRLSDALRAVFAGVLFAAGVIQPGETVERLYRRGELTYAITSARIIKHVGTDVWNGEEFEEFHFDDVTGLDVERGEVNSQLILEVDGRPQRIKSPTDDIREIRVNTERALLAHHEMDSLEEFNRAVEAEREAAAEDAQEAADQGGTGPSSVFDSELDLIGATAKSMGSDQEEASAAASAEADAAAEANPDAGAATMAAGTDLDLETGTDDVSESEPTGTVDPTTATEDAEFEDAGFEPAAGHSTDAASEIAELRRAVERQNNLLEDQQQTIERLIEELRRGR